MQCKVILFKAHAAAAAREVRESRPNTNDLSECLFRDMPVTLLVMLSKASVELFKSVTPKETFKKFTQQINSC